MDRNIFLYPAQNDGVERFLALKRPRMILAYGTGCGKTPTAIVSVVEHLKRSRLLNSAHRWAKVLVVCPAIVRRHWVREFQRWANMYACPIEMGRKRKTGAKKALKARDEAYAAPIQVVSYDLATDVDLTGWDFIVFDEIHHLSDYTSRQSRVCQALMRSNPGVAALGLSATLIPTEVSQLWHPMHLLFGTEWGRPPRSGKICWDFVGRYCHLIKNEYGTAVGEPRESRISELRNRVANVAHRLNREDIADDLPPIDCSILEVPGEAMARPLFGVIGNSNAKERPDVRQAIEWYRSLETDITHAVILCYHREIATMLMEGLRPHLAKDTLSSRIDGSMATSDRIDTLENIERAPRGVLVATTESLREGVRLMWPQKVLLAEWRQSPAQVVQVLGRFYSVGDRRRPQIQVLSDESLFGQAQKLLSRMSACNQLIKAGSAERVVEEVFAPSEMTEERMAELTRSMIAEFKPSDSEWVAESEEADEW